MQFLWSSVSSSSSSSSSSYAKLITLIFFVTIWRSAKGLVKIPENVNIPGILVFGDSIVDAGNNNNLASVIKCNFPPYGINFRGGLPTGRFCDGKIPSDLIAEELGIKDIVPAYLDPAVPPQELITGVTFASGGSGYDPLTPTLVSVISLSEQLNHFKEYIEKLKAMVGEERGKFIVENSIYFVVAGSDDIANTYFVLNARKLQYDVPAYTQLMADSAAAFVQDLYKLGARRIGLFSVPPIGCVPSQRTLGGGLQRDCAENYNQAATLFNSKLSSNLDSLLNSLPNSRLVYVDIYNPLLNLIQNPHQFGFSVSNKGCCGTGALEVAILCNKATPVTCANVSNHVFWDSYHPTENAYKILVSQLVAKYIVKFY